jgi:effector-binding domain-containing protein
MVCGVIRSQNIPGAGRNVAVYQACQDGQINVEVGVEIDGPFAGHGDVVPSTAPAGLVAMATHFGPYGQLPSVHEAILTWC